MLEDSEEFSVRVLDFGLAQLEEADTLTAVGDVPGTLAYIAPERLAGREATGAADVWSVGVFLWEALAGKHPFWAFSPLETARRVSAGAPSLASLRPDLPRKLTGTVDAMLAPAPARRPPAKEAAAHLRSSWSARGQRPRATMSRTRLVERGGPAALAAVFAGAAVWLLPFFPSGWPFLIAALAAALALASPTAGLGFALAVPILPLGNMSLGLAALYAVAAAAWFIAFARDSRTSFLFLLGPALAPAQAFLLVPALVLSARGAVRRACLAAAALPAAIAVAGLTGSPLPLTGEPPPASLELGASPHPGTALAALQSFFVSHQALWIESAVLAAAAVAAPYARTRGMWGIAVWGSALLGAALLAPLGAVGAFPLALWVWVGAAVLAVPVLRTRG
jgi:hypothetical protein